MSSARWHLGQLVMATIGVALVAAIGFAVLLDASDDIDPTTAQALGYSGADADTLYRLEKWSEGFNAALPSYPDSAVIAYLGEYGVVADSALSLTRRFASRKEMAAAALAAQGIVMDFSAREAVESRARIVAMTSALPPFLGLIIIATWWWRWFGARAPEQVSRSTPSDAREAEAP